MTNVWRVFLQLHTTRTGGELGPNGIPFSEILAWTKLMQEKLEPWEVQAIHKLDETYISAMAENNQQES